MVGFIVQWPFCKTDGHISVMGSKQINYCSFIINHQIYVFVIFFSVEFDNNFVKLFTYVSSTACLIKSL